MPSSVFMTDNGQLAVGRDAQRLAQLDPGRYEPNPKRRIDEPAVLLGSAEVPTVHLLAAVLRAAAVGVAEITRVPPPVVLTCPASWGNTRRRLLHAAAIASAGALDLGAARVGLLGDGLRTADPDVCRRLQAPRTSQRRRDRRLFWEEVRGAKDMLSRTTVAPVTVPGVEAALHLTREE